MNKARFGPAGNADAFLAAGYRESKDAPAWLAAQGLTAYEYQCGHGVQVGEETARKIGLAAAQHDIYLSIHAPYYINLSSAEDDRVEKNIKYVLQTARLAQWMGASRMVVHCGGLGKRTREECMKNSHENIQLILTELENAHLTDCTICLETMGKQSIIGSAEEICKLVSADERLLPCIDFGHLNCRTQGGMNSRQDVKRLLNLMEQTIGIERTHRMHVHFSHIEYGDKGEIRHLTFADTVYGPDFLPVAQEIAARKYQPVFICESSGTQAEDACTMQQIFLEQQRGK